MLTNLERLEQVARRLEPLLDELTRVGGSAVGLVISDPAADPPRPTEDVDFAVMAASNAELYLLEQRLRKLGFDDPWRAEDPIGRLRVANWSWTSPQRTRQRADSRTAGIDPPSSVDLRPASPMASRSITLTVHTSSPPNSRPSTIEARVTWWAVTTSRTS